MISFDDIFGQEAAIGWLRAAHRAGRLTHGLIFAGPAGVGKGSVAQVLTALFLCERPAADAPCGGCASCRAVEAGSHPDYHVVTKELVRFHDKTGTSKAIDFSIKVIAAEVVEAAGRKSALGQGKVFVVEQADLMNAAAQNALLKTLEEPAGRTLIILLTDQPESLLPTIRSRCQLVRFAALDDAWIRNELARRGIDPVVAAEAARLASGSVGSALRWIEDGVVARAIELEARLDALLSGRPDADLPDWFKQAAEQYATKQLERDKLGSKDAATRDGLILHLKLAADFFRARLTQTDDPDELDRLCDRIDAVARAQRHLDGNVNVPLVLQQLAVSLERGGAVSLH